MSYPEIPPVELLSQLAPDVREYCLKKVNTYYRDKRNFEEEIANLTSLSKPFYYKNPAGKICVLRKD